MDLLVNNGHGFAWHMDGKKRIGWINRCSVCGKHISVGMTFYDGQANRYCYDCNERRKKERKRESALRIRKGRIEKARELYKQGKKPSEIAAELSVTREEVYKLLSEGKND